MLVGDALGVWFGMVKFCARAGTIVWLSQVSCQKASSMRGMNCWLDGTLKFGRS